MLHSLLKYFVGKVFSPPFSSDLTVREPGSQYPEHTHNNGTYMLVPPLSPRFTTILLSAPLFFSQLTFHRPQAIP